MGSITTGNYTTELEVQIKKDDGGFTWWHSIWEETDERYTMIIPHPWDVATAMVLEGHLPEEEIMALVLRAKIENRG